MRAEVIIACRGETPDNLARTLSNLRGTISDDDGVCVVMDGDRQPDYTLPDWVRLEHGLWPAPRGCGAARHHGIRTSKAGVVVLIDGHMTFPAGWLDAVCDHLAAHSKDVTCAHMQSLAHDWTEIQGQHYAGAYIALKSHEDGNQYWALCAKWNRDPKDAGQIGAPMGACYGMRRDWYERIGQPLRLLDAWGGDEELLGLCSWLCGGRTWLLPITCGHIYAAPRLMRVNTRSEDQRVWANRLAVLRAIPNAPDDLEAWVKRSGLPWPEIEAQFSKWQAAEASKLRKHLQRQRRTFAGLLRAGWAHQLSDAERASEAARPRVTADAARPARVPPTKTHSDTPPQPAPPVLSARPPECPACGNYNTMRPVQPRSKFEAQGGPVRRCERCGHRTRAAA